MFVILIRDHERVIGPFETYEDAKRVLHDCGLADANHVIMLCWRPMHFLTDVIKLLRRRTQQESPKEEA